MQQLVDAIAATLDPAAMRKKAAVATVSRAGSRWRVSCATGEVAEYDAMILAVPAYHAAKMLGASAQALAEQLAGIRYSSSVTVALGYEAKTMSAREHQAISDGFGFLVPAVEGRRILAATFVHNKFPHRVPDGGLLLRVVLSGGSGAGNGVLELSDEQILAAVRRDLREILGLRTAERFARVYRWRQAMAQYDVGHLERIAEIERLRQQLPGLALAGNAYSGIGVPDCIRTGKEAAQSLVEKSAAA
jgi:oxygen-dependent protoporphyrinogen oxidase